MKTLLKRWNLPSPAAALKSLFGPAGTNFSRVIRLDAAGDRRRFIVDAPDKLLGDDAGAKDTWVTVTREGNFTDPRYGDFEITGAMLDNMVRNFTANVFGQKIFIDIAHRPSDGAAGEVLELRHERDRLRALVRWTPLGVDAINNKGYTYLSIEYAEDWQDNETRQKHGPTMLGAGLVVRPALKRLDPVGRIELAELAGDVPTFLHPELQSRLTRELQETQVKFAELIKLFKEALQAKKIKQKLLESMVDAITKQLETVAEETQAKALISMAESAAIQLNESYNPGAPPAPIQLSFNASGTGLDEQGVLALMERVAKEATAAEKRLAEGLATVRTKLAERINQLTSVPEEERKKVLAAVDGVLSADMSDAQVKALADALGAQLTAASVATQLAAVGYHASGNVLFTSGQEAVKLGEMYSQKLKRSSAFSDGTLRCPAPDKLKPFVAKVLAAFDNLHQDRIALEERALSAGNGTRMLAGGQVGMADTNLPIGFQRQTILEALSDLRILDLVNADVDPTATVTTQIPYEVRDVSTVYNDGVVYEGQPIHRAGVSQQMDIAYITPMKLAMLISNEVAFFSRASSIDWDATSRNIASNARLMRELIARRLANEMQRSADSFAAVAVAAEAFDGQLTGANSIIKTAQFPVIRPFQARDIQGNAIGVAENPITLTLNNVVIAEYDGTNQQAAGTYYRVLSYNLGYIQLVNQLGVAQTPADAGVNTIGYKYSTNVVKVDLDLGAFTVGQSRDKLIRAIGAQKALMSTQRFVKPDFLLMADTLHDEATNADSFVASLQRAGTDATSDGDLARIKGVSAWGSNEPGINLGAERILMGQRGQLGYRIAKPYVLGEPFEAVDGNGKAIGKKQAYGEEYSAIKMPTPLRGRFSSILAFSYSGR